MEKLLICILALFAISTTNVRAHLAGQPPFFKVNGVYSGFYNVPVGSTFFDVPQDAGPSVYLVGESIEFEIDTAVLPVPPEIVTKTNFIWNYGDGTQASGLKNKHSYSKPGSYHFTIDAQYGSEATTLLQSTQINVLPNKNYQLPKAIIITNGKESKDPLTDFFYLPYGKEIYLDGSRSEGKSSKIVEYSWDLGDTTSSSEQALYYTYSNDLPQQQVFPILRVKDENGFISDAYVQISNTKDSAVQSSQQQNGSLAKAAWAIVIGAGVIAFLLIVGRYIVTKK